MQLPVLLRALTNRASIGGSSSGSSKGSGTTILASAPAEDAAAGQYTASFESYEAPVPADPAAIFAAQQAAAGVTLQQQQFLQPMVLSATLLDPANSAGAAYYTPAVAAAFATHQQQASAAAAQQQQQQQQLWQQQQQQYSYGTWLTTPQPTIMPAPATKPISAGQSILSKVAKNTAASMYPANSSQPPAAAAVAAAALPVPMEASQIWSSSTAGGIFNTQEDSSYAAPSSNLGGSSFSGSSGSSLYSLPRIPIPAAQYIQAKPMAAAGSSYGLSSLLSTMAGSYGAGSPPARLSSGYVGVTAAAVVPDAMPAVGIVPKPRAAANRLSSGRRRML
jgi:hypothetical protein